MLQGLKNRLKSPMGRIPTADVFISYAREQDSFAKRLRGALEERSLAAWRDREQIPETVAFMPFIEEAIPQSHVFLFVVSLDSVQSDYCKAELGEANRHRKRIVPVRWMPNRPKEEETEREALLMRKLSESDVFDSVRPLNWFEIRESEDFAPRMDRLVEVIRTDYPWLKSHTHYDVKATEWVKRGKPRSLLLHGRDVKEGERWLKEGAKKEPEPTQPSVEYVRASRRWRTVKTRVGLSVAVVLLVLAGGFWLRSEWQRQVRAIRELISEADPKSELDHARAGPQSESPAGGGQQPLRLPDTALRAVKSLARAVRFQRSWLNSAAEVVVGPSAAVNLSLDAQLALRRNLEALTAVPVKRAEKEGRFTSHLAASPDGELMATFADNRVWLWNWKSQELRDVAPLEETAQRVTAVRFSPDGSWLAIADEANGIHLVNTASGQSVECPGGGPATVLRFAFDEGRLPYLAAIISDGREAWIKAWRTGADGCEPWATPVKKAGPVPALALRDKTSQFATATLDVRTGSTRVELGDWRQASGEARTSLGYPRLVPGMAFSPDGRLLGIAYGANVDVFESDSMTKLCTTPGQVRSQKLGEEVRVTTGKASAIDFSPDGKSLAVGYSERIASVWELPDCNSETPTSQMTHEGPVRDLAYTPEGRLATAVVLPGRNQGLITIWRLRRRDRLARMESRFPVSNLGYSQDGRLLLARGGMESDVWEAVGDGYLKMGGWETAAAAALSPDGSQLALGGADGCRLEDIPRRPSGGRGEGGKNLIPGASVTRVAFDPRLQPGCLALATSTGDVYVRKFSDERLMEIPGDGVVSALAVGPACGSLAIGGSNGAVIWRLAEGAGLRVEHESDTPGTEAYVTSLSFSPDGRRLATAGVRSSKVVLWDVEGGRKLFELKHTSPVSGLAFTADGIYLATAAGKEARIWRIDQERPVALIKHDDDVAAVAFRPTADSRHLATAEGNAVQIWLWRPEDLIETACGLLRQILSREEWERGFSGEASPTCPASPTVPAG